ncbi:MAG TPA: N-acetyltransferase [Fulvivirga sp.]|nr:N-acetyltransferase [Fulvivirga sp.]
MISILNHKIAPIANQIYEVFQVSYAVEAQLLKATDFPPLKRTANAIQQSSTMFYGYKVKDSLAAVMEIESKESGIHICSLVVSPTYFRQGIGRKLVSFAKEIGQAKTITVETGLANGPAISLYKNAGFVESKQYLTDVGIWKIAFILNKTP